MCVCCGDHPGLMELKEDVEDEALGGEVAIVSSKIFINFDQ